MLKKFCAVFLAFLIALSAAACSNGDSSQTSNSTAEVTTLPANESEEPDDSAPDEDAGYKREPITLTDLSHTENGEYSQQSEVYTQPRQSGIFSAASGVYEKEFELTLSGEGEIYYTTDGSDPANSDTAVKYTAPIKITDRKNDKNVVSAVDPLLIDAAHNNVNSTRDGFVSTCGRQMHSCKSGSQKCRRHVHSSADGNVLYRQYV